MTLVQLEYVLAVAEYKNFTSAAEKTFVTQPTLSMQIKKLEKELNIEIFDRRTQPIQLTPIGIKIVDQAQIIVKESRKIKQLVLEKMNNLSGTFFIGVIPTVFPTLVPLFLKNFQKKYPGTKLILKEMKTKDIVDALHKGNLDFGIAVTPLVESRIKEQPIFYEPMVGYIPQGHVLSNKPTLHESDLNNTCMLLLEEGHCFRNNVINLCQNVVCTPKLDLDINSFSTLIKLSKENYGITLLPSLYLEDLSDTDLKNIKRFNTPEPTREVSLIYHENQIQKNFINALLEIIKGVLRGKIYLDSTHVTSPKINLA